MNSEEYTQLEAIESSHWFYRGKRDIVRHWIERFRPLKPDHLLVDVGAGTGRFVEEMSGQCRSIAVDDHEESLAIARTLLPPDRVKEGNATALPFPDQSVDVLTALDVLEHVENDAGAVSEFRRALKPDGLLVLTVPALMSLWSDWDVSLHHFRRYNLAGLKNLFDTGGLPPTEIRYINALAFPAVWGVRKWRARFPAKAGGKRAEDKIPAPFLNSLLHRQYVAEATQRLLRPPAGVGLLLCAFPNKP